MNLTPEQQQRLAIVQVSRDLKVSRDEAKYILGSDTAPLSLSPAARTSLLQVPTSSRDLEVTEVDFKVKVNATAPTPAPKKARKSRAPKYSILSPEVSTVVNMTKQGALPEEIAVALGFESLGPVYVLREILAADPRTAGFKLNRHTVDIDARIVEEVLTAPPTKPKILLAHEQRISYSAVQRILVGEYNHLMRDQVAK